MKALFAKNRKKKLTDAKSLENSADSGFASFCSAKVENNPEYPNDDDGNYNLMPGLTRNLKRCRIESGMRSREPA